MIPAKPLVGWRVLVPRGGPWGHEVAADLRAQGASPVVAPMINFAGTADTPALEAALQELAEGGFQWMSVTSATTVDVLSAHRATIPAHTRIAAVGETTSAALLAAGFRVDFVPTKDNSARGLLDEWTDVTSAAQPQRILALRSDIARPVLTDGLRALGHHVESVVAYRTVGVAVDDTIRSDVAEGRFRAIFVTSGSVAVQVQDQLGPVPDATLVVCIGPRTAGDARNAGLRVDLVAEERSAASLINALLDVAARERPDEDDDW